MTLLESPFWCHIIYYESMSTAQKKIVANTSYIEKIKTSDKDAHISCETKAC